MFALRNTSHHFEVLPQNITFAVCGKFITCAIIPEKQREFDTTDYSETILPDGSEAVFANADAVPDGSLNMKDVLRIRKILAGAED